MEKEYEDVISAMQAESLGMNKTKSKVKTQQVQLK